MNRAPDEFRKLAGDAVGLLRAGRSAEAEQACRNALEIVPGDPAVTHNLGVAIAAQGRPREALGRFDDAIRRDPGYVSAHYNRAAALLQLHETRDAIEAFSRVTHLEPQHYEAHRALGFLWLSQGDRGRALDHLARTYELRRGDDRIPLARTSLTTTTRRKLEHDAEQFLYLSKQKRDRLRYELFARNYRTVAKQIAEPVATLSDEQIQILGEDYNTPINLRAAPEIPDSAVHQRTDLAALTAEFHEQGAVSVDDLLTPAALDGLRRFLLESTVWHDFSHIDGFVASYLEDGLACPLLLQIADELRRTFPEILGDHSLSQAWAFKGLAPEAAVDVHADDAITSVNFWVTPAEANLAPERGGLVVCRAPPPEDWRIDDYDADQLRIAAFLEQRPDDSLTIPYKQNRAVIFRSRLFHYSDRPVFAPGYENHRINLTLLYG